MQGFQDVQWMGQNKLGQNKLGQNKLGAVAEQIGSEQIGSKKLGAVAGGAALVGDIALNKRCTAGTAGTDTFRRQLRYMQSMLDPHNTTHVLLS